MLTRPYELELVDLAGTGVAGVLEVREKLRNEALAAGVAKVQVIVFANGKGGVGKSSSAAAFSQASAAQGIRVAHIELDSQGNNAEDFGYVRTDLYDDGAAQAAAVLSGTAMKPTGEARPGLFVVPGGDALEEVVEELYCQRRLAKKSGDTAWLGMYAASIFLMVQELDINLVVLDVAPGSLVLQLQALVAGDGVIVPSKSDLSSRKGLRVVAKRFVEARVYNPFLSLLGVLLFATGDRSTRVKKQIREALEEDLQGAAPVFETHIRHVEAVAVEARKRGRVPAELATLDDLDASAQRSAANLATDYRSFTTEALQRIAARRAEINTRDEVSA